MPRIERTAAAVWEGNLARGGGSLVAGSGAFSLPCSLPSRIGAPDGRTSPEELLAAAHAGCFAMSLAGELRGAERLDVRCTIVMDEVAGRGHLVVESIIEVDAVAPGVDEAAFRQAVDAAHAGCPFSALIGASASVTVRAQLQSR